MPSQQLQKVLFSLNPSLKQIDFSLKISPFLPQPDGQMLFFFLGAVIHLLSSLHTLCFSIRALKRNRILYAYQLLHVLSPRCGHEICSSISFFALPTRTLQVFQSLPVWPHLRHLLVRKTCWNAPLLCCCSFPTSPFILCYFYTECSSPTFCMWSLSQREHTAGTLRCYQLRCPPHPRNRVAGSFFSPHVYLHGFQSLSVPLLLHFLNNWSPIMNHWEAYSWMEEGKVCSPNMTGKSGCWLAQKPRSKNFGESYRGLCLTANVHKAAATLFLRRNQQLRSDALSR